MAGPGDVGLEGDEWCRGDESFELGFGGDLLYGHGCGSRVDDDCVFVVCVRRCSVDEEVGRVADSIHCQSTGCSCTRWHRFTRRKRQIHEAD